MRMTNIAAIWDNACTKLPNALACIYDGQQHTYAETDVAVARVAGMLRHDFGVGRGDRVALAMPNCGAYLTAYWAVIRIGAIVVPVNIKLRDEELEFVLANSTPAVVFVHDSVAERVGNAMQQAGLSARIYAVDHSNDGIKFVSGEAGQRDVKAAEPISGDELAVILYTSGTTGQPKGAIMRHDDLIFNVENAVMAHSFRSEDRHLLAIPFFAPTASYSLLASSAYLGSAVVIAPQPNPGDLLKFIELHRVTTFIGVPTLFHLLCQHPQFTEGDMSSLRLIAYSGSPMPVRTITNLRARFPGIALHNFFGLTESTSMTHVLSDADADSHPDSIGKTLPEVYARVVDDNGNALGAGEVGELCLRRDNVISGYWRQPGKLEASIRDGWFHTGDFASCDAQGFWYVQGRKKDMIIVAGQNVYALEVEKCILRCAEVQEVAVIGVEATGVRAALGELVKAVVVRQPEAELSELDVKRHCSQYLPSYKIPQIVEFVAVLPRNPAGKILKRHLK